MSSTELSGTVLELTPGVLLNGVLITALDLHAVNRPDQHTVLTQANGEPYPEPVQKLFTDLLHIVGPGQMHWCYSTRADALLLVLLPPADAQSAAMLTQHYLRLVLSQLLSQRSLGLTGLLYLLRQDDDWAQVWLWSEHHACEPVCCQKTQLCIPS